MFKIKKDITATKEAISSKQNSGWVEGLNTKFKLVKRILYGRAKPINLEKIGLSLYRFESVKTIRELLKKAS